jgi:D-arabinono-1,4-lactone oxidase
VPATSWAGNHVYRAARTHHPASLDLAPTLNDAGLALANLASLPHISVGRWRPRADEVDRALPAVEGGRARFGAGPHWGKVFRARAPAVATLDDRAGDFARLAARLDPRRALRNAWSERVLG